MRVTLPGFASSFSHVDEAAAVGACGAGDTIDRIERLCLRRRQRIVDGIQRDALLGRWLVGNKRLRD